LADGQNRVLKIGYLPSRTDIKTVYKKLRDRFPAIANNKNKHTEDKGIIIKEQLDTIRQLENRCAQLQFELRKSRDLYLYSSLKHLLENREYRDAIMKANKNETAELKKMLTEAND